MLMSMAASVVCAEEHEYVDLGLPSGTLWATCNVGANSPEEYGDYFAWGETTAKTYYDWSTYKYCNGSMTTLTKYCTDSQYGEVDNKTKLELSDDAAYVNWGEEWCMPSSMQFDELISQCDWEQSNLNGIVGYIVKSKINSNSIFLPSSGHRYRYSLYNAESDGDCWWSSELDSNNPIRAWDLLYYKKNLFVDNGYRINGRCIRPVRNLPKCATPTITYKNGKLTFACDTEGVQFVSSITNTDINTYNEAEIDLSVTYTIRVHATFPDYYDSEEAVGTLCWIEVEPKSEGVETAVKEISALPVLIQSNNGTLRITGAEDGAPVSVYTTSGQLLGTSMVHGNEATVGTNLHDGIAVVKIGNRAVKVLIK